MLFMYYTEKNWQDIVLNPFLLFKTTSHVFIVHHKKKWNKSSMVKNIITWVMCIDKISGVNLDPFFPLKLIFLLHACTNIQQNIQEKNIMHKRNREPTPMRSHVIIMLQRGTNACNMTYCNSWWKDEEKRGARQEVNIMLQGSTNSCNTTNCNSWRKEE